MGLTKRRDKRSYFVEFFVIDDGEKLKLAPKGAGRLKRWAVGSLNKTAAKQQEAIIKTQLMTGQIDSPAKARAKTKTFREWADVYLGLEEVKGLASYATRKICVVNLVEFFGDKLLTSITSDDVREYRTRGYSTLRSCVDAVARTTSAASDACVDGNDRTWVTPSSCKRSIMTTRPSS